MKFRMTIVVTKEYDYEPENYLSEDGTRQLTEDEALALDKQQMEADPVMFMDDSRCSYDVKVEKVDGI